MKWPGYYPDSLPATLDVGKGSPTAIEFGYGSSFPGRYREALYILDWAYGRVVAVHLVPNGASYAARAETFLRGRPLNVTDIAFDARGDMYLLTGGRRTRSAIYRVRWAGDGKTRERPASRQMLARQRYAAEMRSLRRSLERHHRKSSPGAIDHAWPHLSHVDRWIRHAARTAIEHQDLAGWRERVFAKPANQVLPAAVALARVGGARDVGLVAGCLLSVDPAGLSRTERLMAVRAAALVLRRDTDKARTRKSLAQRFDPVFPTVGRSPVYRRELDLELCRLLTDCHSPRVVPVALALLRRDPSQADRFHYLSCLADGSQGWTTELRREFFHSLRAARLFQGDQRLPALVRALEKKALSQLDPIEAKELGPILESKAVTKTERPPRPVIQRWTTKDLEELASLESGNVARGKKIFGEAGCDACHRLGGIGVHFGPDLQAVAGRFTRRDLLRSIVDPSEVVAEIYRSRVVQLKNGKTLVGRVIRNDFRASTIDLAADPTRLDEIQRVKKSDIAAHEESP
ncbi:MAG: c-type cytochrome, partial [Planctomycetota bacterium]